MPSSLPRKEYNEYMRKYMAQYYKKRKQAAIELLGGKCISCGSTESLEIDHIDPTTKRHNLHSRTLSKKKYFEELKKCQVLCKSCHKKKSDMEQSVDHGGGVSGKKNCKCDLCKAKKAEYNRMYAKHGCMTEWPKGPDS